MWLVYIYIRIDVTKCIFAYVYTILFTHQQNNRKKAVKMNAAPRRIYIVCIYIYIYKKVAARKEMKSTKNKTQHTKRIAQPNAKSDMKKKKLNEWKRQLVWLSLEVLHLLFLVQSHCYSPPPRSAWLSLSLYFALAHARHSLCVCALLRHIAELSINVYTIE